MDNEKEMLGSEPTLLDYWRILWKRRWIIIGIFVVSVISTLLISLKMEKIYESTATVFPPEIEGISSPGLEVPGVFSKSFSPLKSGPTPTDIVVAMLKSRTMLENAIRKFNLKEFYEADYIIDAVKKLRNNTKIKVSEENVVSITVESTDSKLAADITNFYVENLDVMNEELKITTAKPIVRILDTAKPAERKSKPRIRINMMIAGLIALFVSVLVVFFLEYLQNISKREKV